MPQNSSSQFWYSITLIEQQSLFFISASNRSYKMALIKVITMKVDDEQVYYIRSLRFQHLQEYVNNPDEQTFATMHFLVFVL